MTVASNLLLICAIITLCVGVVWLLIQAFRQSIWWGLILLLLFPLAVFVFPFIYGKRSLRPLILICASIPLSFASVSVEQKSITGLVIELLIGYGAYYAYSKAPSSRQLNSAPNMTSQIALATSLVMPPASSSRFGFGLRRTLKTLNGIVFDSIRCDELLVKNQDILQKWGNLPKVREVARFFANSELVTDVRNFNRKYFAIMLDSKSFKTLNWQDERCQLFFQMMKKKYGMVESQIIAVLLYVQDEEAYNSTFAQKNSER